jgi:hypothetical protein
MKNIFVDCECDDSEGKCKKDYGYEVPSCVGIEKENSFACYVSSNSLYKIFDLPIVLQACGIE